MKQRIEQLIREYVKNYSKENQVHTKWKELLVVFANANKVLLNNAEHFTDIGLADVCGKCLVGLPCSFGNPVEKNRH